jgi:competence protein ComEA
MIPSGLINDHDKNMALTAHKAFEALIFVAVLSVLYCLAQTYYHRDVTKKSSLHSESEFNGSIAVEIINAVGERGIYFLPDTFTIATILNIAKIELSKIRHHDSLNEPIAHGMSVKIDRDGLICLDSMNTAQKIVLKIPLDLNKATVKDLMRIPGIGEKQAGRIVDLRSRMGRFHSRDDLMLVSGIKKKTYEKIKHFLYIDDSTTRRLKR